MSRANHLRSHQSSRCGFVMIAVLVLLSFLMVLFGLMAQQAVRDRREARKQLHRNQTLLLCDAGIRLAEQRLRSNAAYEGEEWTPDTPELAGRTVHIRIEVTTLSPETRSIKSTAIYQYESNETDRFTRSIFVAIPISQTRSDKDLSNVPEENSRAIQ